MSVIYNGLYSIDFIINGTTYNTWRNFGLIPKRKPIIMPPEPIISINNGIPNKYYLDDSGSMGAKQYINLDAQDYWDYSADIQYRHRTGEWEFITDDDIWAPNNDTNKWVEHYRTLVNALHGKKLSIKLNNYDDLYYDGYIEVSNYSSDEFYSSITLTYYILENAVLYSRFFNDIIPEYPEQELPEHNNYSDKIDYTTGPTAGFVIDQGGGVDIDYEEVPPEVIPEDPDNPENPDEPTEHYANAVQYATDPEPYTADGWILAKSGYFELNDTIKINDDYYAYKNDADVVPLKSITQSGYGIEYRVHIYTNNPINYNIIFYNDYDNSLNDKCYESGINFNSKKYDDCYKIYTNNIKTYTNNPWIYIIPGIKQDIGLELLPNSFSYFIYINTNNTAVAVPGQDKLSINFNVNPENRMIINGYELVKTMHGFPLLTRSISNDLINNENYMSIDDSVFKIDRNEVNDDIGIDLIIIHNNKNNAKLMCANPSEYHGEDLIYYISSESTRNTVQRDFYTIDEYGWTGGIDTILLPLFNYDSDDKNIEYTYFLYINQNTTQLVDYNNTIYKWYPNTPWMFFSDIKPVPNTGDPNYVNYQLIKHGYDAPDIQRYTNNDFISYAISSSVSKLKSKNEDGIIKFYVRIYTSNSNLNLSGNEAYNVVERNSASPSVSVYNILAYSFSFPSQDGDYSYGFCSKTITIDTPNRPIWYYDIETRVRNTRNIEDIDSFSYFIYIDPTTTEVVED